MLLGNNTPVFGLDTTPDADMKRQTTETPSHPGATPAPLSVWRRVGPLRLGMSALVLTCLPLALLRGEEATDWFVLLNYIAPVLVLLFFFMLLLDMLMNRVFMAEKPATEQQRHRLAIGLDFLLLVGILLFWGPFFFDLLARR